MKRLFPLLLSIGFLFWLLQPGTPVRGGVVQGADYITLEASQTASVDGVSPRYEVESNFISPVYEADHEFQLLGLNWQQEIPVGTAANMAIRFQDKSGEWSDWQAIHQDHDFADHDESLHEHEHYDTEPSSQWSYVMTNDSVAFQYKAELSTADNGITPKLADIQFDYIDGGQPSKVEELTRLVFDDNDDIISREEWGADESWLYAKNYNRSEPSEYENQEVEENNYPELEIVETQNYLNGEELLWPVEYPKNVEKIIIHHTASTEDLDDPEKLMRSIYAYHALSRGWGDIGYNYLIDAYGNVYEGRYGGDGAVAGHTAGYNTASVGIALLGHFEETPITSEMMQALMGVVYDQSVLHGIDPDGSSTFRGERMPNLMGHRDLSATACPGEITYEFLDEIRESVGKSLDKRRNMNFDEDFAFESVGDHEMVSIDPEGDDTVTLKIKNVGEKRWNNDTFLTYDTNNDGVAMIEKDSNKAIAMMKESFADPGDTATFTFDVEATLKGGMTHFDLAPIFNGEEKTTRYLDLAVYVEQPMLEFDIVDDNMPEFMKPGQSATVTLEIENEGNFTWKNDGDHPVVLKQSGSSSLTDKSTLAKLEEDEVEPGEVGSFEFKITAPTTGGTHSLYVFPDVEDSNAWVEGTARLRTKTSSTEEDAELGDVSDDREFEPGEEKNLWVEVRNTTAEYWSNEELSIRFDAPSEVVITKAYMRIRSLPPGASAKVFFTVEAPDEEGTYNIELMPTLDGEDLLDDEMEFDIEVMRTEVDEEDYEMPIRIKLTPEDMSIPIVSSQSSFALYSGDKLLDTFKGNSRLFVAKMGGTYNIITSKGRYIANDNVRIVPEEGGIMQLLSMSQVPGWNDSLNDNKFRGTLEIQEEDGKLIVINELPLEDYLKGIAEVSNNANPEKAKTILVLARSYAYYYMTQDEKFPGADYHLDDDPNSSQKYLGYGFEERSENITDYVEETAGQVVTYDDEVVKTPYFSESPGYTMSAESVWGWTNTPWLQGVQDPYCDKDAFWGHGVGLSGCGATGMAEAGYLYDEIIEYYYQGVELSEIDS